jgi:hypothetical protein
MQWISLLKNRIFKNNPFCGYSQEDILSISLYVKAIEDKSTISKSIDLRLRPYLTEINNCIQEKNHVLLDLHSKEIKRLLELSQHRVSFEPLISNTIHVPNWIVVLFVPFDRLPLYINLPSDLYRALIAWRLKRGR